MNATSLGTIVKKSVGWSIGLSVLMILAGFLAIAVPQAAGITHDALQIWVALRYTEASRSCGDSPRDSRLPSCKNALRITRRSLGSGISPSGGLVGQAWIHKPSQLTFGLPHSSLLCPIVHSLPRL